MNILRKVIRTTIKSMLWCYLYLIIFALALPIICNTWFYSAYYNGDLNSNKLRQRVEMINRRRFITAILYTKSLNNDDLKRFRSDAEVERVSKQSIDIVIGIVTVNKDNVKGRMANLGYLTQTTAGILSAILRKQYKEFDSVKIFVCDVDTYLHPEARDMSELVDLTERHQERVSNDRTIRDAPEKEKDDYVFCLERAADYRSKYIMLLEDDIVLDTDSFETLNHLIRSRITQSADWLFVKLFYPEKLMGYSVEMERLGELVGVGIIGGLIFSFIELCFTCICTREKSFAFSKMTFFMGFWTCIAATYVIGRQYLMSWKSVSPYTHRLIKAPGCRAHAVLYKNTHVPEMLWYLRGVIANNFSDLALDTLVDKFADLRGFKRYLVEPNVGKHIGYISNYESRNASEFIY